MSKSGPRHPIATGRQIGVPQGGVFSGLLSNLYVTPFDKELMDAGYFLIRYADDFLVSCRTDAECKSVEQLSHEAASRIGLCLHPKKTERIHVSKGFDFVGFRLKSSRVSIRAWNVEKFRTRIRETIDDRKYVPSSNTHFQPKKRLINHLNAKIRGGIPKDGGNRRSWMAYFRIVNDVEQIRRLNRWLWQEFSRWHAKHYGEELGHSKIRQLGLRSLVTEYWSVRRELPTRALPANGPKRTK